MRRLAWVSCLWIVLSALGGGSASALETRRFMVTPRGEIEGVRTADIDGDGRPDLVLLVSARGESGAPYQEIVLLRTPATPTPRSFYPADHVTRIDLRRAELSGAGAATPGRFGEDGAFRVRFFTATGILDVAADGTLAPTGERHRVPTLLGRGPGRALVFWDGAGDLDDDGRDESWFPEAAGNGIVRILGGTPAGDRRLELEARNRGASDVEHLLRRHVYVPKLLPADLDGDGRRELLAYRDGHVVAWPARTEDTRDAPVPPTFDLTLPFVKEHLGPDEVYTPRLQVADADGDGRADLLVTLVTGDRRQVGSFRTRLLHFPGPFRDPATGALVPPSVRIDTESVALHPRFLDLNGDGALDYVLDAIRGTKMDLIRQVLGQEPSIWHVGFLFDRTKGTFEEVPYFSVKRSYSREQAVSNTFGPSAFFDGDYDGDGHTDLLDLGNLEGLEILAAVPKEGDGPGDPVAFSHALVSRVGVPGSLQPDARVLDLDADGRTDIVVWNETSLFLLLPRGSR